MNKLYQQFTEFFEKHKWNYHRQDKPILHTHFCGEHGRWMGVAIVREEKPGISCLSLFPSRAPFDLRAAIAELLTRLHYGLIHGSFQMDVEDGKIRFKTSRFAPELEVTLERAEQLVFVNVKQRRRRPLTFRSEPGGIEFAVDCGRQPGAGRWCCPIREQWQLGPHEKLSPGFAEKLCFTATATGSEEKAAQVASKWSQTVDDSTLHALVRRVGVCAEGQPCQIRAEDLLTDDETNGATVPLRSNRTWLTRQDS